VQIQLQKNIPIGAGLGGGSSDAAATLVGLNQLWNLRLGQDQLNHFALLLGSDVPYFVSRGSAYATGRGELLEYFPLDLPYWIVIVYPNLHISTTWAYQQLDLRNGDSHRAVRSTESSIKDILVELIPHPRRLITSLMNDFEPTILAAHPEIGQIKKKLYDLGAEFAQLSGSGSSVYGLFIQEEEATHAISKLKNGYQTFITPPSFTPEIPVATH
jgi:4-diphosphocytidyl-2-C-methyl-D-erythritol kinase